jgi:hypothetical protein
VLGYDRVHDSIFEGYVLNGFDLHWLLKKLQLYLENNTSPFYSSTPRRRTFFDVEKNVYIKIPDERLKRFDLITKRVPFHKSSDKYFRFYQVLVRLGIPTPKLLACVKIKRNGQKSIIATEGVTETQPMSSFLRSTRDSTIRTSAINELSKIAAILHAKGYYLSLDLRNILAKVSGEKVQLFVLDLEHMKPTGLFFKRRIKRNLRRAKKSLIFSAGGELDVWETFMNHYKKAFIKTG